MAAGEYTSDVDRSHTPFSETEALLAVMNDDIARGSALVRSMTAGERDLFARYVDRLERLIFRIRRESGEA